MKLGHTLPACGVAAALLAGCFSGTPDRSGWRRLGDPVATTSVAAASIQSNGTSGSVTWMADVAIEPGSGDLLVTLLGDEAQVVVVKRGTGEVLSTAALPIDTILTTPVGPGRLMVSWGSDHSILDLATGELLPVTGLEALASRSFPVMASSPSGDLGPGDGDVVVSLECEPERNSPIEVWGGSAENRVLLSSTPFRVGIPAVLALAYAPDLGVVFLSTTDRLVAINLTSGRVEYELLGIPPDGVRGLAYDGATGRLLLLEAGSYEVLEYEL